MTMMEANHLFVKEYYGDHKSFVKAVRDDYYKVQLEWSCYIDDLCREGVLTERQWQRATFPAKKR